MATVSGTVKDSTGAFAARLVRAYRRSDGALAGQTISNATTGAYSIPTLDGTPHFAVMHDGTPSVDPYWSNVVLAMHMDGTNGSTVFTDLKGHVFTKSGTAAISTAQSKFGGASAAFSTSTANKVTTPASTDFVFTGAFTIEAWVCPTLWNANGGTICCAAGGAFAYSGTTGLHFWLYVTEGLAVLGYWKGPSAGTSAAVIPTSLSAWSHIAFSYDGTTLRSFTNGVLQNSIVSAYVAPSTTPAFGLNTANGMADGATYTFTGYIDDLRITKGVARYTDNFTAPTEAFLHAPTPGSPTENALIFDNITPV